MTACVRCGKATSLFYGAARDQCWLCASRTRILSAGPAAAPGGEETHDDRRTWRRFPVQIHMKLYYGASERSWIIFPGTTINISSGGLCVEWTACRQCQGYQPGGVHPACIFADFAYTAPRTTPLDVALFLADEDVVELPAKVVFIMRRGDAAEYLGLAFVDLGGAARRRVDQIVGALVDHG
ncbi:MAG: PilZ domain-containing protein [Planctomycetota bacterium]